MNNTKTLMKKESQTKITRTKQSNHKVTLFSCIVGKEEIDDTNMRHTSRNHYVKQQYLVYEAYTTAFDSCLIHDCLLDLCCCWHCRCCCYSLKVCITKCDLVVFRDTHRILFCLSNTIYSMTFMANITQKTFFTVVL